MDLTIDQIRQHLKKEESRLTTELSELDSRRNAVQSELAQVQNGLKGLDTKTPTKIVSIHPNQFRGKRMVDALEEYLESQKREVSINELVDAMAQGNADLGTTPPRTISIAVSTNPKRLYKEGKMVGLVEWKKKDKS